MLWINHWLWYKNYLRCWRWYVLISLIDPTLEELVEAFSCFIINPSYRPVYRCCFINQNYSYNKVNAEEYLIKLLLHEITYILVFSPVLFDL